MSSESYDHPYAQPADYPAQGQGQGQHPAQGPGAYAAAYPAQGLPHPSAGAAYPWGYPRGNPGGYPGSYQAAQYQGAYASGYAAYPGAHYQSQAPFLNFSNERFLKGLLIGAAAAYLLTNESVQRSAIKGVVKVWSMLQGGVEEIKERFHDAEAEIRAAEAGHGNARGE